MKIAFLGNHDVGIKTLEALSETEEIVGVVAHPLDPEDGVRYSSVYDFSVRHGWRAIRCKGNDPDLKIFLRTVKPDILWITDYRYILTPSILSIASLGAVNLHPSLLPKYRGRASINWAIINGETILGLTCHFVDNGMDTGDIIEQISFSLGPDQDIGDALSIYYPLYSDLTRMVLRYFHSGSIPRRPQDNSEASVFPRRRPEDGIIDWSQSVQSIHNLIRAVAYPYPGAFTYWRGHKVNIWKAKPFCSSNSGLCHSYSDQPGRILDVTSDGICVQCGQGVILLRDISLMQEDKNLLSLLRPGMILGR